MKKFISGALAVALLTAGISIPGSNEASAEPLSPSTAACTTPLLTTVEQELTNVLKIPSTIQTGTGIADQQTYARNQNYWFEKGLAVYGDHGDISAANGQTYDSATQQYRFLGYGSGENQYFNMDYPPDAQGTTDVGTRKWIVNPWENQPNNSHKAVQSAWWQETSSAQRSIWLKGIVDKYTEADTRLPGNWTKITPSPWYNTIDRFFVWEQAPSPSAPGMVTGWHEGSSNDWYDTFLINPTEIGPTSGDLGVDPFQVKFNKDTGKATVNMWNSFFGAKVFQVSYKYSTSADGSGQIGSALTTQGEVKGVKTPGASVNQPVTKEAFGGNISQSEVSAICKDVQKYTPVVNESDKTLMTRVLDSGFGAMNMGIFGAYTDNDIELEVPQAVIDKKAAGEQIYLTVSINNDKAFKEILWSNNRSVWNLDAVDTPFKTPPIKPKDVTKTTATVYWPTIPGEKLDHFNVTCSNDNKTVNRFKNLTQPLTGLTPATKYTCELEAFDTEDKSGGKTTTEFTTPNDTTPPPTTGPNTDPTDEVPGDPTSPGGSGGGWDQIGLIREVGALKQQTIPTNFPKTSAEYKALKNNGGATANTYTPYFGEKLGVYAVPEIGQSSYSWDFTYEDEVWDSTHHKDGMGNWVGDWTTVTRVGTETCQVEYPRAGLSGWSSTTSDPKGKTSAVTTKWGKTGTIRVTASRSGKCEATDSRNPNRGQLQFTYYVPTMMELSPSLLLDKGFKSTTQTIDLAQKLQWIKFGASSYSLGSDARSLSAGSVANTINFNMLWSKYGNVSTGG